MQVLVCIDDTDNIDSIGTGHLAGELAQDITKRGWGRCSGVTRHQLLVHPDIPYTSHNSSMCFLAELEETKLDALTGYAAEFLRSKCAEGSDPGLCIAVLDRIMEPEKLMTFGQKAKREVVTKEEAYSLAESIDVHLSEHGGTGQGIIGALAGVGLRLTGNDGRYKGKYHIDAADNIATVAEIMSQTDIEMVRALDGTVLDANEAVYLGPKVKTVLLDSRCALLVCPAEDKSANVKWETCNMKYLRNY